MLTREPSRRPARRGRCARLHRRGVRPVAASAKPTRVLDLARGVRLRGCRAVRSHRPTGDELGFWRSERRARRRRRVRARTTVRGRRRVRPSPCVDGRRGSRPSSATRRARCRTPTVERRLQRQTPALPSKYSRWRSTTSCIGSPPAITRGRGFDVAEQQESMSSCGRIAAASQSFGAHSVHARRRAILLCASGLGMPEEGSNPRHADYDSGRFGSTARIDGGWGTRKGTCLHGRLRPIPPAHRCSAPSGQTILASGSRPDSA